MPDITFAEILAAAAALGIDVGTKISALPAATAALGTHELAANEAGASKKLTIAQIAAFVGSGTQPLDSDLTAIAALTTTAYGRALLTLAGASDLTALTRLVEITPTVSAPTHNWNPTGLATAGLITVNAGTGVYITGIAAQPGGTQLWLFNVGANAFELTWESALSAAANRFACKNSASVTIAPAASARLVYTGAYSRWIVMPGA